MSGAEILTNSRPRLRVAVCGLGMMGSLHLRVYSEIPDVDIVAVLDVDPRRLRAAERRFGVDGYNDLGTLLREHKVDALSICTPTDLHASFAETAIAAGVNILIEKPLAASVREGERIADQARVSTVLVAVGHVERYNPAVQQLKAELAAGRLGSIFQFHARRIGPFAERIVDTGVVFDLATHDIDVIRYLSDEEPRVLHAETRRLLHPSREDLMIATLDLPSGALASLDVNRVTPTKTRDIAVLGQRGMLVANYLTQELYFFSNDYAQDNWNDLAQFRGVAEGTMTRLRIVRREPLRLELEAFLDAIRKSGAEVITAHDALATLRVADRILAIAELPRETSASAI